MKKNILESIRFLVNSNVWIALATVCFYELSLLQIGADLVIDATVFFLFFSTVFIYNIFRILNITENSKKWYVKNYRYTKFLSFISFAPTFISLYFIDFSLFPIIILASLLTFSYVAPFSSNKNSVFSLRKYWFLKPILVALVWVLLTVVLPLLENGVEGSKLFFFSLEKFFFILGITIPYDIKDLKEDKYSGVNTVALKFGINKTKWISNFFLLIGLLLAFFTENNLLLAIVFIYGITMFLNYILEEKKDELWYTFLVDGTIILYFLTIYIVSLF